MVDMWELDSEAIEERVAFRAEVRDQVWRETKRRMRSLGFSEQEGPATPSALAPTSAAAKAVHLMYLEVATEVGNAARELAADAATRAGRAAATYADLGEAAGITRQAARKRWPDAVGTQWTLYTLTGKSRPHGMATQVFRSSGKAIETGRTAVDEGALADDGAVGAVVVNSAREAVWACYFNDGTWAPEEIAMPEDLQTVPAPGSPEHGEWLHKWDQFITNNL
ncbi:hypothetical protein ABTZ58_33525 [Streptomyces sp. NPDC094143]|uniref:hypothetical protein n=1 Tax=Streptomyces sp. NPDC094143 TaxID=3155310 RepID=UPI00331C2923